jgi:anti-sigma factor RsiW
MIALMRNNRIVSWMKGILMKHMHNMISCKEFEEFILDYMEDALAQAKKKTFELHLRMCPECREYLAAYKRSIELNQAVFNKPSDPLPDDVPEDLIKAILDARHK